MEDKNPGLVIEGFAIAAKNRALGINIDRHHPEVGWAAADVAKSEDNYADTKKDVQRTINSLTHALYHERTHDALLTELSGFSEQVEKAQNPVQLSDVITDWRPVLDRALDK
jgi:hypothetical protein